MNIDFEPLECRIAGIVNLHSLTLAEKENLWTVSRDVVYPAALLAGHKTGAAKNLIADWLWAHVPALGETRDAIFFQLYRKIKQPGSLADKRREAAKKKRAPVLSQADRAALVSQSKGPGGGFVDFGWHLCLEKKLLSPELLKRYTMRKDRRPSCPKAIRRQVAREVAAAYQADNRPHHHSNNIAAVTRDWSEVCAQDIYECDDKTLDVYCLAITENCGVEVERKKIRCQFLPMIDAKSGKILDFVLIGEANYNAVSIRTLIKRVCLKYGLPKKFQFERGIWKSARLLGNNSSSKPFSEVENFATRCGVEIRHALPGRARTKIVETVFRLLDRKMYDWPGYIGNDEMHKKFECVADDQLWTYDELFSKLVEAVEDYNHTKSESRVKGGYLTPNEVWKNVRRRLDNGEFEPVAALSPEFEYLLAAHCSESKVRENGVKFTLGKVHYHYHNDSLVDFQRGFIGQTVKVWFDPEFPETAVVTDFKCQEFFPVARVPMSPAYAKTPEQWQQFAAAGKPYRAAMKQVRQIYSNLQPTFVAPPRPIVADPTAHQTAQLMGEAKQQAAQLNRRVTAETDAERSKKHFERRARDLWEIYRDELELFKRGSEIAPDKMPTPPDCPDPAAVLVNGDGRDNSNAVLAGFMQETR